MYMSMVAWAAQSVCDSMLYVNMWNSPKRTRYFWMQMGMWTSKNSIHDVYFWSDL